MPVKSNFAAGNILTASDTNTYLTNGGLVYITETAFSASSSISVTGCFSSTYNAYRIVVTITGTTASNGYLRLRMRSGSTDATTNYSSVGLLMGLSAGTQSNTNAGTGNQGVTSGICGYTGTASAAGIMTIDVSPPFLTNYTSWNYQCIARNNDSGCEGITGHAIHYTSASYDGFTIFPTSSNLTGTVRVYGYRQA